MTSPTTASRCFTCSDCGNAFSVAVGPDVYRIDLCEPCQSRRVREAFALVDPRRPVVMGGQGRTVANVEASSNAFAWGMLAGVVLTIALLLAAS